MVARAQGWYRIGVSSPARIFAGWKATALDQSAAAEIEHNLTALNHEEFERSPCDGLPMQETAD